MLYYPNKILNMTKIKVNITELKKIIKRAVKEAKIVPGGGKILPSIYDEPLFSLFGTPNEWANSEVDLYNPPEITYDLKYINDEIEDNISSEYADDLKQIVSLMKQYPNDKIFVSTVYNNPDDPDGLGTCPGAPKNAFYALVRINKDNITLSTPDIDGSGEYCVGWFDSTGKYHPDTENFDEEGNMVKI
jgi:hypothetical protein